MQALIDTPTASLAATARFDLYAGIHKALRLYMGDTLSRLGSADPRDDGDVAQATQQLAELMDICELHLQDENAFIHPALERAVPGTSARIAHEHDEHRSAIENLRDLRGLVCDTRGDARCAAMARLYHACSLFIADNFVHMHEEETAHNAVLWAHYDDAALMAIEREIVAYIPPQAMLAMLHWFVPALSAPERSGMFRGMQGGMPPEAFLSLVAMAKGRLSPADHAKLAADLGVAS